MSIYCPDPAMESGYEWCARCREEPVPIGMRCTQCEAEIAEENALQDDDDLIDDGDVDGLVAA